MPGAHVGGVPDRDGRGRVGSLVCGIEGHAGAPPTGLAGHRPAVSSSAVRYRERGKAPWSRKSIGEGLAMRAPAHRNRPFRIGKGVPRCGI